MSSRALRRAQKEKEQVDQLRAIEDESDDEGSVEVHTSRQPKMSAFALLGEEEDDAGEQSGQDIEGEAVEVDEDDQAQEATIPSKPKKKKNKKKKKGGAAGSTDTQDPADQDLDDIDRALQELNVKQRSGQTQSAATDENAALDEAAQEANNLLSITKDDLHVQNEMKRLFGRAALEEENDDEAPVAGENAAGLDRRQRRLQQHNGRQGRLHGATLLSLRRNVFVQGKEEWPQAVGSGLGMEVVERLPNSVIEYRYIHHRTYQEVQQEFDARVETMDPNALIHLLREHPGHVSTLLQVSELLKQQGDHAQSREMLERALFVMGRAVHSTFVKQLGEGRARLDFRRPENRELWLAGWRYMQNLIMRGTWRTVYSWAKLLLALAPGDPYSMWLVLDQYALKSKQDLDFLNISRNATYKQSIDHLPSIQLSRALAEFRSGNRSKGQQALYTAISRYPWFIARLMQELDIDAPPAVWGQQPRNEKETLHASLYAVRAKDIWNTPEHSALLLETASAVPTGLQPAPEMSDEITLQEARHVILSEIPSLIALVPRHFTNEYTSASDPLPPSDSIDSYSRVARSAARGIPHAFEELQRLIGDGEEDLDMADDERVERVAALMHQLPPGLRGQITEALQANMARATQPADEQEHNSDE